jgi:lipopolysaccharide biosynthesis glycosyltransferase
MERRVSARIPVVYCFDAGYSGYAAVSMASLHRHARTPLKFHCIVPASDLGRVPAVEAAARSFGLDVSMVAADERPFADWKEAFHINRTTYLKLLIPSLIDESTVVYVDADTIVLGDLAALHSTPLNGTRFAGVIDPAGAETSRMPRSQGDAYINAGVMVMDLDGLRQDGFLRRCGEIHAQYHASLTWLEQCIINKFAENRKTLVDPRWNRQVFANSVTRAQWTELVAEGRSAILHFVGPIKPWMQWCNPLVAEFWWRQAAPLRLADLKPTLVSGIEQGLALAEVLDLIEDHRGASGIKGDIIKTLLDHISRQSAR